MSSIEALPVELMQQIFSELSLESHRDLKSCRLVNHRWDSHATELLFYQVKLSVLWSDRNAFINISNQPCLAKAVRVIVWDELCEGELSFVEDPSRSRVIPDFHRPPSPDTAKLFDQLRLQVRELLWVPAVQQAEQDEEKLRAAEASRAIAIRIFSVALKHALPKFSNVHTFVSRPMDPCRRISTGENGQYPITERLIHRGVYRGYNRWTNQGCSILLDAVVELMSDGQMPTLRQLYIADEGPYSTFARYPPPCAAEVMLKKLTHIDLCFGIFEEEDMERLRGWLESATNLQYLRLCMGCCNLLNVTVSPMQVLQHRFLSKLLERNSLFLPALNSLHLEDVGQVGTTDFLDFIRKHASTLRTLQLHCFVSLRWMIRLANIEGLHLVRFVVQPLDISNANTHFVVIPERIALDLLDSLSSRPQLTSVLRPHVSRPICVYPHNDEAIPVPASEETGTLRGVVAQDCNSFSPEDLDWGRRMGGTDLLTSIPTRCSSPTDRDVDMMSDIQCASVDEYAREAIWDLRRWREAPRWLWSALGGDIYYWVVTNRDDIDNIGYPTEIWKFTHNSEVAWGEEPFEFWEDWRGPESGDTAEPTPFGHRFTRFREIFDRYLECGEYVEDILHSHAIPLDRAVRYHRLLDPMLCPPRDRDTLTSQWASVLPWP
ncbi:hypothetical protein SCAR479_01883 [Seiridium cardinale]|uniref:F-box domain-containing protein n=1 Tax=Seiridium cardinale TaxID=138064 RepID=A0ABR2Y3P8_9PEZI